MGRSRERKKAHSVERKAGKQTPTVNGHTSREAASINTPYTPKNPLNEESPLMSPTGIENEEEEAFIVGGDETLGQHDEFTETKNLLYMILLTISIGGLQLAWAVELSNGTPYLLSLGLSKSLMALVWIAGPLSGALVQPYVGILSDNCRSPWGKRTPFMVAGGIATVISLLALAWVREMVGGILGLFGADPESDFVKTTVIIFAVLFIYMVDFAINTGTELKFSLRDDDTHFLQCRPPLELSS